MSMWLLPQCPMRSVQHRGIATALVNASDERFAVVKIVLVCPSRETSAGGPCMQPTTVRRPAAASWSLKGTNWPVSQVGTLASGVSIIIMPLIPAELTKAASMRYRPDSGAQAQPLQLAGEIGQGLKVAGSCAFNKGNRLKITNMLDGKLCSLEGTPGFGRNGKLPRRFRRLCD